MDSVLVVGSVAFVASLIAILSGDIHVVYRILLFLLTVVLVGMVSLRAVGGETASPSSSDAASFWNNVSSADPQHAFSDSFDATHQTHETHETVYGEYGKERRNSRQIAGSSETHDATAVGLLSHSLMQRGKTDILSNSTISKQRNALLRDYRSTKLDKYMEET